MLLACAGFVVFGGATVGARPARDIFWGREQQGLLLFAKNCRAQGALLRQTGTLDNA